MPIDLAADAAVFFSDFAETVVYRPREGEPRTIQALVDRDPPEALGEDVTTRTPVLHVTVRNDSVAGITAAEVDTGGDRIDLPLRVGGSATTRPIVGIVRQDAGLVTLEVR